MTEDLEKSTDKKTTQIILHYRYGQANSEMQHASNPNSPSPNGGKPQQDALAILEKALFYDNDDRTRKISFHEPLTSDVREIPRRTPEENLEQFYQREDFALFQTKEQQRYDKVMMKRIQEMVTEAMKDELEEAYARNATPEEIDAMMPQTTEEIFALLGGMPTMDMMNVYFILNYHYISLPCLFCFQA